jgi:hypothetical protein
MTHIKWLIVVFCALADKTSDVECENETSDDELVHGILKQLNL